MSCPAILQGYTKACRDSQGGVSKFYITEHANIDSYTESSGVLTALTMVSGRKFWLYEQELNVAHGEEALTPSVENGTTYVDQTFTARLNKRGAPISYALRALSQQNVSIIEVEQTGTMFIYGVKNGLSMQPSTSGTGTGMGDHNGYELIWKGGEPHFAYTVDSSILSSVIV